MFYDLPPDTHNAMSANETVIEYRVATASQAADSASSLTQAVPLKSLSKACVEKISSHFDFHPDILWALLIIEGGKVGEVTKLNKDGTYDIGLFGINSSHLPRLTALFNVTEQDITRDGCVNGYMAGFLLYEALRSFGHRVDGYDDYISAIARYHRWKEDKYKKQYEKKIKSVLESFYGQ